MPFIILWSRVSGQLRLSLEYGMIEVVRFSQECYRSKVIPGDKEDKCGSGSRFVLPANDPCCDVKRENRGTGEEKMTVFRG